MSEVANSTNNDLAGGVITKSRRRKNRRNGAKRDNIDKDLALNRDLEEIEGIKLKVVIRHLPPNLPKNIFEDSIKKWNNEQIINFIKFIPGKIYQNANKKSISSRAYLRFNAFEFLTEFYKAYNGHKFVNSKGMESFALVDFAPNQKVAKASREDSKISTIETDPEYIKFTQILENKEEESEANKPNDLNQVNNQGKDEKITPLIEFLRSKKNQKLDSRKKKHAGKETDESKRNSTQKENLKVKPSQNKENSLDKKGKEGSKEYNKNKGNSSKKKNQEQPFGNKQVQILKPKKQDSSKAEEELDKSSKKGPNPNKNSNKSNASKDASNSSKTLNKANETKGVPNPNKNFNKANRNNNASKSNKNSNKIDGNSDTSNINKNSNKTNGAKDVPNQTPRRVFTLSNGRITAEGQNYPNNSNSSRSNNQHH